MASRLHNEKPESFYDRYDLRYDRSAGRSSDELNKTSEEIRAHYQKLEFLRKCTTHLIGVLAGGKIARDPDHRAFPKRSDRPNERDTLLRELAKMNQWEIDVAEKEVCALMRVILQIRSLTSVRLPAQDFLLYRVHNSSTKSLHDPSTGIRCSAWADTVLLDEVKDPVGTRFRNHMNSTYDPSPYISVHTSAARMVKLILSFGRAFTGDATARVYVISYERLCRLGIKAWCSEDGIGRWRLRKGSGGDGMGVSYVTSSHWLVEGWIPDTAVVGEMRVWDFLDTAASHGITRDKTMGPVWNVEVERLVIPREMIPERRAGDRALVPVRYQAAGDGNSGLETMFSTLSLQGPRYS